jgi:hypothetical protein
MWPEDSKQRGRQDDAGKRHCTLPDRFWEFSFCSHELLENRLCANCSIFRLWLVLSELR